MDFQQKVEAIEKARKELPEFDQEFKDYLGLGHSFNGAYNHFSLADIEKYRPKTAAPAPKPAAPAPTPAPASAPKTAAPAPEPTPEIKTPTA